MPTPVDRNERGSMVAEITRQIVALHHEHYGRGPTKARTFLNGDYVTCFMEDIYTTVERTLIEAGRFESVRATRLTFQDAMEPRFREIIQSVTGRKVRAFLSQVYADPEAAVDAFVLEPAETNEPSA